MVTYHISYQNPLTQFIDIILTLSQLTTDTIKLQLPVWRPGRYERANYAKNIQKLNVVDTKGQPIAFKKSDTSSWEVTTKGIETLEVHYNYYANQLDAGGSWLDEQQLYLNFVNCLLYAKDRMAEVCEVHLTLPTGYQIACGLPQIKSHVMRADNYYQLVDSPMIASNQLVHHTYQLAGTEFHLWIMGKNALNWSEMIDPFKAFSREQGDTMGGFPFEAYHFLFQIPPNKKYHGVEHAASTVIALGPAMEMDTDKMKTSLLGVSSHELFHAWNVIRIRPKELLPYDFSRENYFPTGFVAEGVTTYYGDLFLVRSGVFEKQQYFTEVNLLFKRHFENYGRFNLSLIDASYDLWLDGYETGTPNRKVSIYTKGAIVALMLDLTIRKHTGHTKSLDDLMKQLWQQYGAKQIGYSLEDYREAAESITGVSMQSYFEDYIMGTEPLESGLMMLLPEVGCELVQKPAQQKSKHLFGFQVIKENELWSVTRIAPGSPAETKLSLGDQLSFNGQELNDLIPDQRDLALEVNRRDTKIKVQLQAGPETYFPQFELQQNLNAKINLQARFTQWLGCSWQ